MPRIRISWAAVAALAAVAAVPAALLVGYWQTVQPTADLVARVEHYEAPVPAHLVRGLFQIAKDAGADSVRLDSIARSALAHRQVFRAFVRNVGAANADSVILVLSQADYYHVEKIDAFLEGEAERGRIPIGLLRPDEGAYVTVWTNSTEDMVTLYQPALAHSRGLGVIYTPEEVGPFWAWVSQNYQWIFGIPLLVLALTAAKVSAEGWGLYRSRAAAARRRQAGAVGED